MQNPDVSPVLHADTLMLDQAISSIYSDTHAFYLGAVTKRFAVIVYYSVFGSLTADMDLEPRDSSPRLTLAYLSFRRSMEQYADLLGMMQDVVDVKRSVRLAAAGSSCWYVPLATSARGFIHDCLYHLVAKTHSIGETWCKIPLDFLKAVAVCIEGTERDTVRPGLKFQVSIFFVDSPPVPVGKANVVQLGTPSHLPPRA